MEFDSKPTGDIMRPLLMHSCLRLVPWHCDENTMPLIDAALREFNPEKRLELVHDLMRDFHENPTMLYLHESVSFDGLSRRIRNYDPVNRHINYSAIEIVE
jgi:ABC-type transport system substrate-binding protein